MTFNILGAVSFFECCEKPNLILLIFKNILQYYCLYCIFNSINVAFLKTKNLNDSKLLNCIVCVCVCYIHLFYFSDFTLWPLFSDAHVEPPFHIDDRFVFSYIVHSL